MRDTTTGAPDAPGVLLVLLPQQGVLTAEGAGMDAAVPDGVDLPSTYDPRSGQEWTRDRLAYLTTDLQGRLLALEG